MINPRCFSRTEKHEYGSGLHIEVSINTNEIVELELVKRSTVQRLQYIE